MTIEELRRKIRFIVEHSKGDVEQDHVDADELLLEFIGDVEVASAYNDIEKWYA